MGENSGISAENQAKLEQLAKKYVMQYGQMAQKIGKEHGINFNFKNVANGLQKKYANKAQKASKATFNGILNNIQNQAKAQLQKIKDPKARKNLIALLDNGAQQAKDQLKKQRLLHANIKKTVETKVAPQLKERGGKLQNEIDTAIGNF